MSYVYTNTHKHTHTPTHTPTHSYMHTIIWLSIHFYPPNHVPTTFLHLTTILSSLSHTQSAINPQWDALHIMSTYLVLFYIHACKSILISLFCNSSRWCKKALTTSQRLQMSFVEIGDEHIFKLKIQKGTWSYPLRRWPWITLLFFFTRRHKFGPKGLFALTRRIIINACSVSFVWMVVHLVLFWKKWKSSSPANSYRIEGMHTLFK